MPCMPFGRTCVAFGQVQKRLYGPKTCRRRSETQFCFVTYFYRVYDICIRPTVRFCKLRFAIGIIAAYVGGGNAAYT